MKSIILHLEDLLRLKSGLKRQVRKPIKFRDPYVDNFQDNIAYACPAEALPGFPSDCWWFSSYAPRSSLTFSVDAPFVYAVILAMLFSFSVFSLNFHITICLIIFYFSFNLFKIYLFLYFIIAKFVIFLYIE